jgi:hypothetical protein
MLTKKYLLQSVALAMFFSLARNHSCYVNSKYLSGGTFLNDYQLFFLREIEVPTKTSSLMFPRL